MTDFRERLRALGARLGVADSYWTIDGRLVEVPDEVLVRVLGALGVDAREAGEAGEAPAEAGPVRPDSIEAARCWRPLALQADGRVWGPTVQLYSLRSARNWGVGDFGDLLELVRVAATAGADFVGLNPLHARFFHDPANASPYSPSSRRWLNVFAIDVGAVDDFVRSEAAQRLARDPAFAERLARLRASPAVDHVGVAALKAQVLALAWEHFRQAHLSADTLRGRAFRSFREAAGASLRRHAIFEALHGHFRALDPSSGGWPSWPREYHDADGDAVARFAAAHDDAVGFAEYLQWIAHEQLQAVADECERLGMAVGLYLDLAVSVDRAGSDVWSDRRCYAEGASVGAPPDAFNEDGQDWGLPPLHPQRLREAAYAPLADALRAAMRYAGALRIDHVMGLMRLFWIPRGARAGTYVHYRLDESMALVARESARHRCLVVGEDLGTVPDEVRAAMARFGVLAYRLMLFEREPWGDFRAPAAYAREALAAFATHDLPTLAGWWTGRDLQVRRELGMIADEDSLRWLQGERAEDRRRLLRALQREGLLPDGLHPEEPPREAGVDIAAAVQRMLARTPSALLAVQVEDMIGEVEQANLPGTVDDHPNWCRRLSVPLEALAAHPGFTAVARAVSAERPRRLPYNGGDHNAAGDHAAPTARALP
jgi:(1->4)-alpha-D-glucan 1-alpha-D-glucosylmutase